MDTIRSDRYVCVNKHTIHTCVCVCVDSRGVHKQTQRPCVEIREEPSEGPRGRPKVLLAEQRSGRDVCVRCLCPSRCWSSRSSTPLLDTSPSFESISKYPEYYGETRSSSVQLSSPRSRTRFSSGILTFLSRDGLRSVTRNLGIMLFRIVAMKVKEIVEYLAKCSFDKNDQTISVSRGYWKRY